MAQAYRTELLSGYFDCRIFRQGVAKENRQMKNDGDTVTFDVGFAEYPVQLEQGGGGAFIREAEVNGLKRWYVSFKVGRICRFFDKDGQKTERLSNADLDGKRWDACIQYKVLHGDPAKMQPRGFWADAIQLRPADEIAFAPMGGGQGNGVAERIETTPEAPDPDKVLPRIDPNGDLPF